MTLSKLKSRNKGMADLSDKDFLHMATVVVLDNVANESFTLDQLLGEMNISRTHLYRKIKFLTGQNPSSFIRTIRLKYAAHLLGQYDYPIKEIALLSGFGSHVYFIKTFREMYGITPQKYQKRKRAFIPIEVLQNDMEDLIDRKVHNKI